MDVNSMAILILLGSFFLMIMLRFPIAYAVALSSVFCLMAQGLPLTTICQQMVKGLNSFSLMAVPFFITMGGLMGGGGISERRGQHPQYPFKRSEAGRRLSAGSQA